MKKLKILFLIFTLLALPIVTDAGNVVTMFKAQGGGAASGSCTSATAGEESTEYLACEDFEGSSACADSGVSVCRSTWKKYDANGTFNRTTGALEGTNSYAISANWNSNGLQFTDAGTVYVFFKIRIHYVATKADLPLIYLYNETTLHVGLASADVSDGTSYILKLTGCGGDWSVVSGSLSYDTTYNIWIEYAKGTGANGVSSIYISSTSTKGSAISTNTTHTCTTDVDNLRLGLYNQQYGTETYRIVLIDHIRIGSSQMSGVPD